MCVIKQNNLGIIGGIVKNNRLRFWEVPEGTISKFSSITGTALVAS